MERTEIGTPQYHSGEGDPVALRLEPWRIVFSACRQCRKLYAVELCSQIHMRCGYPKHNEHDEKQNRASVRGAQAVFCQWLLPLK